MRKTSLKQVLELARIDERICFIGSDLGFGVMEDFRAEFPERIFREGISEQHIIGMAAGMALEGKVVYINTIASFLFRRCFEQIYLDLCLNKAKVRLIASGGGLVYAPLGPTHLAAEDFAALRPLPNMTILAPCDATEMARLMPLTMDIDGPVYIRLAKGGDTIVSSDAIPCIIGQAIDMTPSAPRNVDILFITTGIATQRALDAAKILESNNLSVRILHNHTIKPLDSENILAHAKYSRLVVSLEEHVRTGGLGSAVAEILAENNLKNCPAFLKLALPDAFFSQHGSQNDILQFFGLDAEQIANSVHKTFTTTLSK